jgi:hypothetical protein
MRPWESAPKSADGRGTDGVPDGTVSIEPAMSVAQVVREHQSDLSNLGIVNLLNQNDCSGSFGLSPVNRHPVRRTAPDG